MKNKLIAKDRDHLRDLIKAEIEKNGLNCDLNSIDVSSVPDMSDLFSGSEFNGDISGWKPYMLQAREDMFKDCAALVPYWYSVGDLKKALDTYVFSQKLNSALPEKRINKTKNKI